MLSLRIVDSASFSKKGAIHECSDGFVYTAPIGQFTANEFKLQDMIGNARELVEDCCTGIEGEPYSEGIRDGSVDKTVSYGLRATRGGSWYDSPVDARAARRNYSPEGMRTNMNGFRLARTL